jgi:hypothetical protein
VTPAEAGAPLAFPEPTPGEDAAYAAEAAALTEADVIRVERRIDVLERRLRPLERRRPRLRR